MSREEPMSTTSGEEPIATNPELFAAMSQQNWENVRHIKSERMWYLNTHAVTSAGVLTFLQSVRRGFVLQSSLLLCICFLSAIGLLTSLRLKAELEECLSTDQVAGFTSSMKKGIGRGVMAKQLTEIFERSRASFQQRRSVSRSQ